jgi:hypothetical protein
MPVGISQLLNWGSPWQTATPTPLNTAVTQTISPQGVGPQDFAVATAYLYYGSTLRVTASGWLTTTATSTTATIFLAAGTTPTTLCTPPGVTTGTTVITQVQWRWMSYHTIIQAGASTGNTISSFGFLKILNAGAALPANPSALTATGGLDLPAPASGGDTLAAVNTSVAMPLMMRGTLAGANATVQCNRFLIEHLYA